MYSKCIFTCYISKFLKFWWIYFFKLSSDEQTGYSNKLEPVLGHRFSNAEVPVQKINRQVKGFSV